MPGGHDLPRQSTLCDIYQAQHCREINANYKHHISGEYTAHRPAKYRSVLNRSATDPNKNE